MIATEKLNVHQRGVLRDVARRIPDSEHITPAGHYPGPTLGALFRRGLIRRDPSGAKIWEITDAGRGVLESYSVVPDTTTGDRSDG